MKTVRHAMILQLIESMEVDTQEALAEQLMRKGVRVTQATISRDIKDLRLVKTLGSDGKYRYTSAAGRRDDLRSSFAQLFSNSVTSIDLAQNIVVIKTLSGMANAVCAAMDSTDNAAVVGTIAGDDTVMMVIAENTTRAAVLRALRTIIPNI